MNIKTIMTVASALGLAACLPSVLWTSPIEGANLTGTNLPIVAQGNTLYQLYPVGTQLHLRKLDSAGAVQWQTPVDESLASSLTSPKLRASDNGVTVGYQDSATKTAFVKSFDLEGVAVWASNLGEHASETLDDMTVAADGSVTVAVRLTNTVANLQRYDATGALQWETALPACFLLCATTLGLNDQGQLMVANTEALATRSYLMDSNGTQVWYRYRSTGLSTLGLIPNKITATGNGFALLHPFSSWHYDLEGNLSWTYSAGSQANIAVDAASNFYIPGVGKVVKLDSAGVLVSEIDLSDQNGIRQIQWRDDLQRLIVLTNYESVGPEIDGTITADTGQALSLYDAEGTRKARYRSKASMTKSSLCTPYPQCTTVSYIPGETWGAFATTTDKKLVVSGLMIDSERHAKAYRMP